MSKPNELSIGNEVSKKSFFQKHEKELLEFAENERRPEALIIGCADSRVIPTLITNSNPGDLFVIRNAGNFIAPYKPDEDYHSTIEYAINALNSSVIIVCDHRPRSPTEAIRNRVDGKGFFCTKKRLSLGKKAKTTDVKERVDAETLHVHGWFCDMATGTIGYYDPDDVQFKVLEENKGAL